MTRRECKAGYRDKLITSIIVIMVKISINSTFNIILQHFVFHKYEVEIDSSYDTSSIHVIH